MSGRGNIKICSTCSSREGLCCRCNFCIYIIFYRFYTWVFCVGRTISCNICAFVGNIFFGCFRQFVALVVSLFKLVVKVASPLVRSVTSVLRFVVKVFSALVALVVSLFKFVLIESSALVRLVISVASAVELPVEAAST